MNNKNNKYNSPSIKKQNEVLKQNARVEETIKKSNAIKHNPPKRPERVSNIKEVEYDNFSNLLICTYKNELQRHDLTEKTRRLILDSVIAKSNLLKNIMLVSDDYLEINTIKENDGFTTIENIPLVSNNNSERIVVKGTEFDFKEIGGNSSVFAQKLEDAIQDKLETKVINDLKANETSILVSKSATIIDEVLAIKNNYSNREFVIAVGLKNYIELTSDRTEFPIKVIYVPKLNDEVLAFISQNVYANLVLGSVDTKKDIMTGICYVACNILSLETYMQNVVSIKNGEN